MKKRLFKPSLLGLIMAVFAFVALPLWAHDFKQLRVVVNQLDAASVPDRQQREKEMNDILKQCEKYGIYLQVTIEKVNTNQNPTRPDGTPIAPDGKVSGDKASDELDAVAKQGEVKTNGVKVWVAKEVRQGTNSITSSNAVVNGLTTRSFPSTAIREQSGVNGDARTWTHEVAHTLGLAHAPDTATTNLMHPARSSGGTPTGSSLTADQCKQLQKGADLFSPETGKTKEQTSEVPAKTVSHSMVDSVETGPPLGTPYDLNWAHLVVDYHLLNRTNPALHVDTFVHGTLDPPPLQVRYLVWLNLDNNPATGDPAGYDAVIIQQVMSPTEVLARLRWLPGGMEQPVPASWEIISRFATGETNGWEVPIGAVVHCEVPRSMIPSMGPVMRVRITSANESLEEFDAIGPEAMTTIPPPKPVLTLNVIETLPGNMVIVQGEMFTPLTPYRITYDSTIMAEGMTGPLGEINAGFVAPDLVPGDYLVDAIDAACRVQIAVLRMLDNQGLKIRVEGDHLAISFRTHPGPTYILECKEDLAGPGPWMELQRTNTVEPLVTMLEDPLPDRPRFYRWRQE